MGNEIKTKANETAACCCVDVGSIIDNDDCTVNYDKIFKSEAEANEMLMKLTSEAKKIESDPCIIESEISQENNEWKLNASFTFCCGTESLIFQLKLR